MTKLRILITLACLLFLSPQVLAQDGGALRAVSEASDVLRHQQAHGLDIQWTSRGKVAGVALRARFQNTSREPIEVHLVPGLVIEDSRKKIQPMILEESVSFTLDHNEVRELKNIHAYSLDHTRSPGSTKRVVPYGFVRDLTPYKSAIQTLWAGVRLDSNGGFNHTLGPRMHRTIVLQRSLWAALGAPNPTTLEKLHQDLIDDTRSGNHPFDDYKVEWMAKRLWTDVEQTLKAAEKE